MTRRHAPEHVQLLHGPYTAPALRRGDKAVCLYRDGDVMITGWSDGRISWPRCRLPGTHGGGSGLLVDEELARAVRAESSLAIQHWWGVRSVAVWKWRRALGVDKFNEGSRRLRVEMNEAIGATLRGENYRGRLQRRKARQAAGCPNGRTPWAADELALLGTLPDEDVARQLGRTVNAVTVQRLKRRIPSARDRRRRENR